MLPCPRPCQLTHPARCASGPTGPISHPGLLYLLPPPPAAQQLLRLAAMGLQQAQEGGAGFSVTAHLQTLLLLQPSPLIKIPRTVSWIPTTRSNLFWRQSIRIGMPLSQVPIPLEFLSKDTAETQIPKVVLMLRFKIWLGLLVQFLLAVMLNTW